METPEVGRIIITYEFKEQEEVSLRIQNLPPILALGILTLACERLKREVMSPSISPVVVPTIGLPRA